MEADDIVEQKIRELVGDQRIGHEQPLPEQDRRANRFCADVRSTRLAKSCLRLAVVAVVPQIDHVELPIPRGLVSLPSPAKWRAARMQISTDGLRVALFDLRYEDPRFTLVIPYLESTL